LLDIGRGARGDRELIHRLQQNQRERDREREREREREMDGWIDCVKSRHVETLYRPHHTTNELPQ